LVAWGSGRERLSCFPEGQEGKQVKRYSRLRQAVTEALGDRDPRLVRLASWMLLYAAIFMVWLIVRPGGQKVATPFFNTVEILPPLAASVFCILFAGLDRHRDRRYRRAWFLLGLGALSFAGGQSTWTVLESVLKIDTPYPSWADIGYLGVYPFVLLGLTMIASPRQVLGKAKLLLDTIIVLGSVMALSWYFVLQPLYAQADTGWLAKAIGLAYPLGDLGIVFCALVIMARSSGDRILKTSMSFLVSGVIGLAFADTVFAYLTLHERYQTGSFNDPGWAFGWLLIGYAAALQLWHRRPAGGIGEAGALISPSLEEETATYSRSALRILFPFLAALGTLATILAADWRQDRLLDRNAILIGFALLGLVITRQILTMVENGQLYRKLWNFNLSLEGKVAERTRQLATLHEIATAASTTLHPGEVLEIALEKTLSAMRADAGAIWLKEEGKGFSMATHKGFPTGEMARDLLTQEEAECLHGRTCRAIELHPEHPAVQTVYVPLRCRNRILGVFAAARKDTPFEEEEEELLESVALEVGVALENARLYSQALRTADTDFVTGLLNHRAIQQRLKMEFGRAQELNDTFAVIMMDLDNFKLFNDTYGHPAGDQVLKRIAVMLLSVCQWPHIVGRYGGDEFIAILPSADAGQARAIAQTIRERILREGFHTYGDDHVIPISLSFGIALYPEDSRNRYELLTIADANLYRSKAQGGVVILSEENPHMTSEMRSVQQFTLLDALISAVDNKDHYTRRHSEEMTEYSLMIAEGLGLSEETMRTIRIAGLLHDLGKIGVPDHILRKPGRLTPEEFEAMKQHPVLGARIVSGLTDWDATLDGIRYHHERWDGFGYPEGLKGEAIPLLGRLMAVADAYSAMTTDRPYRKSLPPEAALLEIQRCSGTQFDPTMVEAFLQAMCRRTRDVVLSREAA